jgi:hypothetical protein
VVNWTASEAINKPNAEGVAENELSFEVGRDSVAFMVNGKTVHSLAASAVDTKGIAGLRVNHNLNLHVASFAVHPR